MQKNVATIVTLGIAVLASGCSGGGQSSSPAVPAGKTPAKTVASSTKARLTIKIPIRKPGSTAKSARRKPQYLSAFTTGLAVRTGVASDAGIAGSPWQLFDVSANPTASPLSACTTDPSGAFRTCVVTVTAPVIDSGTDEFEIAATDQAPVSTDIAPEGDFLSTTSFQQTLLSGTVNSIDVALTGVIGQLSTDQTRYTVWAPPNGIASVVVKVTANDFRGGPIAGNPSAFGNPITFSDALTPALTPSPFTYPSTNPANGALLPPATPGPIPATIEYTASATASAVTANVTVATIVPPFYPPLSPATGPTASFALDPMIVSVAGIGPVGSLLNLAVSAPDITVTVTETGATSFAIASNADAAGTLTLLGVTPLTGQVMADSTGMATFVVHAVGPTLGSAPVVTVTDTNGTVATLPAVVTVAAPASPVAARKRVVR